MGINLLPSDRKICNFNCIYCECGFTLHGALPSGMPSRTEVRGELEKWLKYNTRFRAPIDTFTFAGNGEPTLHPEFAGIVDDTVELRDRYSAGVQIAVLSNATRISDNGIFNALLKTDLNILKLDSGSENTIRLINAPVTRFNLNEILERMKEFRGRLIIQTLFVRGKVHEQPVDNTTPEELGKWLTALEAIKPESIMIYTLARETPVDGLIKASRKELQAIAKQAEDRGFKVQISA